jgi:hypothetical protein
VLRFAKGKLPPVNAFRSVALYDATTTIQRLTSIILLSAVARPVSAQSPSGSPMPVTVDNFIRAESDMYFGGSVKQGGFGRHRRGDIHGFHHANGIADGVVFSGLQHLRPAEDAVMKAILVEQVVDAVDAGVTGHAQMFHAADSGKDFGVVLRATRSINGGQHRADGVLVRLLRLLHHAGGRRERHILEGLASRQYFPNAERAAREDDCV